MQKITIVKDKDFSRVAWAGLRRFHHLPTVESEIIRRHKVPKQHVPNVRKQAAQLRYCLIQAQEYRDAASATSLATKPVLLYYSIMSLALAELLMKADGGSSLDAARSKHAHHGLALKVASGISDFKLSESAAALRAVPQISASGERKGTFELWHKIAREAPLAGATLRQMLGGHTSGFDIVMFGENKRLGYLDAGGLSLFECFLGTPGMHDWLESVGFSSNIVRGSCTQTIQGDHRTLTITIHPHQSPGVVTALEARIFFEAAAVNRLIVTEFPNGFSLKWAESPDDFVRTIFPPVCSWNSEEIRFHDSNPLNEFGSLYLGLFILGTYARYFPDAWVRDVEARSPLALAAEEFLSQAERRMALLCLSELSDCYHVPQG